MENTLKQISLAFAIKTIETLEAIYKMKLQDIKHTLINGRQYQKNVERTFETDILEKNIKMLQTSKAWIGHPVYKRIKETREKYQFYRAEPSVKGDFNPTEQEPTIFTEELFATFVNDYLNYQIDYLLDDFLIRSITCNSTDKLTNLEFEWVLESKQELINLYKQLLKY